MVQSIVMPNAVETGRRFRHLREQRGWTQDELAARAGMSRNNYQRIETGTVEPRQETLRRIAAVLEISLDYVLNGRTETADDAYPAWARGMPEVSPENVGRIKDYVRIIQAAEASGTVYRQTKLD